MKDNLTIIRVVYSAYDHPSRVLARTDNKTDNKIAMLLNSLRVGNYKDSLCEVKLVEIDGVKLGVLYKKDIDLEELQIPASYRKAVEQHNVKEHRNYAVNVGFDFQRRIIVSPNIAELFAIKLDLDNRLGLDNPEESINKQILFLNRRFYVSHGKLVSLDNSTATISITDGSLTERTLRVNSKFLVQPRDDQNLERESQKDYRRKSTQSAARTKAASKKKPGNKPVVDESDRLLDGKNGQRLHESVQEFKGTHSHELVKKGDVSMTIKHSSGAEVEVAENGNINITAANVSVTGNVQLAAE